jgi:hypothetical protein
MGKITFMKTGSTPPESRKRLIGLNFMSIAFSSFADSAHVDCEIPGFYFGAGRDTHADTHTFILLNTGGGTKGRRLVCLTS